MTPRRENMIPFHPPSNSLVFVLVHWLASHIASGHTVKTTDSNLDCVFDKTHLFLWFQ